MSGRLWHLQLLFFACLGCVHLIVNLEYAFLTFHVVISVWLESLGALETRVAALTSDGETSLR